MMQLEVKETKFDLLHTPRGVHSKLALVNSVSHSSARVTLFNKVMQPLEQASRTGCIRREVSAIGSKTALYFLPINFSLFVLSRALFFIPTPACCEMKGRCQERKGQCLKMRVAESERRSLHSGRRNQDAGHGQQINKARIFCAAVGVATTPATHNVYQESFELPHYRRLAFHTNEARHTCPEWLMRPNLNAVDEWNPAAGQEFNTACYVIRTKCDCHILSACIRLAARAKQLPPASFRTAAEKRTEACQI